MHFLNSFGGSCSLVILMCKLQTPNPRIFYPTCVLFPGERKKGGGERETKLCGVGRMKEESGGRSVEEAAYGCRKSTAGGSISI